MPRWWSIRACRRVVYPFGGLSGSGVAFKLAWALAQRASGSDKVTPRFREYLLDAVVLATLGTVADVVPLHDENRIFVRAGLSRLRQAPSVGLQALIEAAGLTPGAELRASDVAFKLAPRLNAAGRLGCARLVVELLTTTVAAARRRSGSLPGRAERTRQKIERQMVARPARWPSATSPMRRRWCWPRPTGTAASSASSPAGWPISMPGRC